MEAFLEIIKTLMLFVVIVIAISPICSRIDKMILQLENIQNSINSGVEYENI